MSDPARIIDISVLVHSGLPVFPGDPPVEVALALSRAAGEPANVSRASFGVHSGTHVDAPFHVDSTWPALCEARLDALIGRARVLELDVEREIAADLLAALPWAGVERVLFKTRNSALWRDGFRPEFVALGEDAADFLVRHTQVRLVGIDYLSIERPDSPDLRVHRRLLGQGVLILEGLNLAGVAPGDYELLCLPLRLDAPDGAPARAVLLER